MSKSTVNNEIMQFENQELRKRCEALASQVRLEKERADSHQAKLSRIDVERGRSVNDDQVRNVANMLGSSKIELQEATELILVASDRNDKYLANTSKLTSDYLQAVELIAQLGCKIKTAEHAQSSMEAEIEQLRAKISDLTSRLDSALKNVTELRTQEQKHQEEARRTREQSNALKTQLEEERGRSLRLEQDARKRRADQLQDLHE
jgi:chromosome segregation ATPase